VDGEGGPNTMGPRRKTKKTGLKMGRERAKKSKRVLFFTHQTKATTGSSQCGPILSFEWTGVGQGAWGFKRPRGRDGPLKKNICGGKPKLEWSWFCPGLSGKRPANWWNGVYMNGGTERNKNKFRWGGGGGGKPLQPREKDVKNEVNGEKHGDGEQSISESGSSRSKSSQNIVQRCSR